MVNSNDNRVPLPKLRFVYKNKNKTKQSKQTNKNKTKKPKTKQNKTKQNKKRGSLQQIP